MQPLSRVSKCLLLSYALSDLTAVWGSQCHRYLPGHLPLYTWSAHAKAPVCQVNQKINLGDALVTQSLSLALRFWWQPSYNLLLALQHVWCWLGDHLATCCDTDLAMAYTGYMLITRGFSANAAVSRLRGFLSSLLVAHNSAVFAVSCWCEPVTHWAGARRYTQEWLWSAS